MSVEPLFPKNNTSDEIPIERAAHHAERKKLYEREFPQTRQGGTPGAGGGKKAQSEGGQNGHLRYTANAFSNRDDRIEKTS